MTKATRGGSDEGRQPVSAVGRSAGAVAGSQVGSTADGAAKRGAVPMGDGSCERAERGLGLEAGERVPGAATFRHRGPVRQPQRLLPAHIGAGGEHSDGEGRHL